MTMPLSLVVVGPSTRFLSGISYYTVRLANTLSRHTRVRAILFRHMLPRRLFPGWRRVGEDLCSVSFEGGVDATEVIDWYNPFTWAKAAALSRSVDAVILQWWTSSVAHMYVALLALLPRSIPVIVEFHEVVDPLEQSILPVRVYARFMGRVVRRRATHFVVHSDADRDLVAVSFSIQPERISVIPHPLYDQYPRMDKRSARESLGIPEENVILFFGLLRPYKGVKYLVRAFEELPDDVVRDTRLLIVGEAWEDRETLAHVRGSPRRGRITVIDRYVPDSEVPLYFSAADMLVLPYTRASQSGVAHIAMAYGLPVVATRVGGLVEGMGSYPGAFLVSPESVDELREEILLHIWEKKTYQPPRELTWESVGKKWLELCDRVRRWHADRDSHRF